MDAPSLRLSSFDCKLAQLVWMQLQHDFGGVNGHTCDLMALDSNAMVDELGNPLPHFTPYPSSQSLGVNLFAQDLSQHVSVLQNPYVFPPPLLIGPVLHFLMASRQGCTCVLFGLLP